MESTFGHYRLEGLLDRGGLGDVYRAYDRESDRLVALKILSGRASGDLSYRDRFRQEAHTAARLAEPHTVPIHRYGEIDGRLFVDMRLVSGRTLADLIAEEGALSPERAVSIVGQVSLGLDAAHLDGLVHGDVKPTKIMITGEAGDETAHLAGLGVPRRVPLRDHPPPRQSGSPAADFAYMAPEQFLEQPAGPSTDVYSLACVLFLCLTGVPPFPADGGLASLRSSHLDATPPTPSSRRPDLPAEFDEVLRRGLLKGRDQRFGTPLQLATWARRAVQPVVHPPSGQVGPFGLPDVAPVGGQTVSARGGGGGSVSFTATSASLDQVVALVSAEIGPPETRTDVAATWGAHHVDRGWRTDSRISAWMVGRGGGPGFDPGRVPTYARCVLERVTLSTPDGGP